MTYEEFISKLEEYSSFTLKFKKEGKECLTLYLEDGVPLAALSLTNSDWKFLNQSVCFDAAFLDTMAKLANTPKEQRGNWKMEHEYESFNNYKELAAKHPKAAAALLEEFDEGEWQNNDLYWYPSEEDFAMYEMVDGWYSSNGLGQFSDFKGAPNPLNFIDYKALGKALVGSWDKHCNFETDDGEIVTTGWGF